METHDGPPPNASEKARQDYLEECENKLVSREIDAIARDLGLPISEITTIYSQLYAELKSRARVTDYLRVLVSRKVRARCQGRRLN